MNRRVRFGVVLACIASLLGAVASAAPARAATTRRAGTAPHRVDAVAAHRVDVARRRAVQRNRVAVQILEARLARRVTRSALAPAGGTATLTVTPSTNLGPGENVQLHGSGFLPGDNELVLECAADIGGAPECSTSTEQSFPVASDGTLDASFAVTRHIVLSGGATFDCASTPTACEIGWLSLPSFASSGATPISFDPNAGSGTAIGATPSTGLVDRQQIEVDGSGFPANALVTITECPGGADVTTCFNSGQGFGEADATGAFSTTLTVRRDATATNGTVDCASAACQLVAEPFQGVDFEARAAIAFDPSGPVPEPIAITVTPTTQLLEGQTVTIDGTGFDPTGSVYLSQCTPARTSPARTGPRDCRGFQYVATDANGDFSTALAVHRLIPSFTGADPTDCAVATCDVEVFDEISGDFAAAALSFDGSVPPPKPPTLTVEPARALHDRQVVTVRGKGFTAGGEVYLQECATNAALLIEFCRQVTEIDEVAADGTFSVQDPVERVLHAFDGSPIDCAVPPSSCQLIASDDSGFQPTATIGFARGPLPPPAAVTITPSTKLRDQQHTRLSGTGWFPGDFVNVEECATDAHGVNLACAQAQFEVQADAHGTWHADFVVVRRMVAFGGCGSIDCAPGQAPRPTIVDCTKSGVRCAVTAFDYDDGSSASRPLEFDRTAPPAPAPSVVVTPRLLLHDGQTVHVHGTGFAPLSYVPIQQCDRSPLDLTSTCRDATQVDADQHGVVDVDVTVRRIIQTYNNRVDCITPGVHCVIAVGLFDVELPRLVPVTFDPNAPLQLPVVTATPSTGLTDGQSITISGTGFTPDVQVAAAECGAGTVGTQSCDIGNVVYGQTDASGNASVTLTVHAALTTATGTIDCTTGPGACVIGLANISDLSEANGAPITFGSG